MRYSFVLYDRPGHINGPIVNALRLLPELVRRGDEVQALVVAHPGPADNPARLRQAGVAVEQTHWRYNTPSLVRWMLRKARIFGPDLLVANYSIPACFAARWARAAGVPTIATFRNDDAFHAALVHEFVMGAPRWRLSGLVCVAEDLRSRVESMGPTHTRLATIPSGVRVPSVPASQSGPVRLVYTGRLEQKQKAIRDVLEGMIQVLRARPQTSALLVGDGSERAHLDERIARSGMTHRIRVLDPVAEDFLAEILRECHIAVLLSDYEGTPGSIMDAMACGLVPVCLDIPGGVRELVRTGVTGVRVADRGTSFVAATLALVDDESERQRLALAARTLIRDSYSLQVAADRWQKFGRELVAEVAPKRPIRIPWRLALPPVHPDLAGEDVRPWSWRRRAVNAWKRLLVQAAGGDAN